MNSDPIRRSLVAAVLISAALIPGVSLLQAQEQRPDPTPVVIVGNTRFAPLFEGVTLAPGAVMRRDLDVGGFARLSILAAAESGPNAGRVAVATIFGPPAVRVPNRLNLAFDGGRTARDHAFLPVSGPKLVIEVANLSHQPVDLSLSVLASK